FDPGHLQIEQMELRSRPRAWHSFWRCQVSAVGGQGRREPNSLARCGIAKLAGLTRLQVNPEQTDVRVVETAASDIHFGAIEREASVSRHPKGIRDSADA